MAAPTRRNRVWQTDFTEVQTSQGGPGGSARSSTTRPSLLARRLSRARPAPVMPSPRSRPRSARQSGCSVIRCWKTASIPSPARSLQSRSCFARFTAGRPELAHVRTRRHSPETNDVVERFNESIKYEHLFRLEIPDAITLADEAEAFRRLQRDPPARVARLRHAPVPLSCRPERTQPIRARKCPRFLTRTGGMYGRSIGRARIEVAIPDQESVAAGITPPSAGSAR